MNPQASLDAPRWQVATGKQVMLESDVSPRIVDELRRRGHEVAIATDWTPFGRGQIIWRREMWEEPANGNRSLIAGSDKRSDGLAIGY